VVDECIADDMSASDRTGPPCGPDNYMPSSADLMPKLNGYLMELIE